MTNTSSTPGHDPARKYTRPMRAWTFIQRHKVALAVAVAVTLSLLVVAIVVRAIVASNMIAGGGAKPFDKIDVTQNLVAPNGIPKGIAINGGRFQCDGASIELALKKGGQVKSPKGDTVKAIWSTNAVTVVVTPAEGAKITDAYKAFIFVGEGGTMVASASTPPADATEIRFVANFGKDQPFAPIARATGVSVCVSK